MNNKPTLTVEYNNTVSLDWIAQQIVQLVKDQTRDVYLISTDIKHTTDLLAVLKTQTENDAEYQQVVQRHNVQLHVVPSECLEELKETTPLGVSAVVVQQSLVKRLGSLISLGHRSVYRPSMVKH